MIMNFGKNKKFDGIWNRFPVYSELPIFNGLLSVSQPSPFSSLEIMSINKGMSLCSVSSDACFSSLT
tara:strand:- start:461 stop:661 length:201 start_codon:yes stop_codon:yes gene_type:complete